MILGGSGFIGKIGSICLSATAAMRSGAGMVTVFAPKCGYDIIQTVLPEAMVSTDENEKHLSNIKYDLEQCVIGSGICAWKTKRSTDSIGA